MYGKTLADFPDRFDEFLDEFRSTAPSVLDEAFRLTRGICTEFPTPADVRKQIQNVVIPADRIEAAHQRLLEKYKDPPKYIGKSILDEPKPKPRVIAELSPDEKERRLNHLLAQAKQLTEK